MRRICKREGFTLAETVIAMALLAIIMMAVLPLVDQIICRFQMARDHYVAVTLCQGRIERARSEPYSQLEAWIETDLLVDDFGNPASPGGRFRRTTTVQRDTPSEGITLMTVRTDICSCSRLGWRKVMHPIPDGAFKCHFTAEHEQMGYLFTEYQQRK
ncbi:MAG TPA: type II secretion system protein [Kiritimatiellia bacterium]|nr:type II secretion system protein [Kiritimatiellia bacterium]HPO36819.1 type II secretion system protein [Kiritimatiellia bacterium]HQA37299.1 type II secretion system protein [Kiritimatiellia bacterium]HQQ91204.1 type II secretion system protein [Kiritimatiellia bacterium]